MLKKLKLHGFSEDTINWFRSYLSGHSQYVDVNGGKSLRKNIAVGVFQGSVLFIIYFNDLVVLEDNGCSVIVYADDNNYAAKIGHDTQANQMRINSKLGEVEVYMCANRLKYNAGKTQIMIETPARNKMNSNLVVVFIGHEITPENRARFLARTDTHQLKNCFRKPEHSSSTDGSAIWIFSWARTSKIS